MTSTNMLRRSIADCTAPLKFSKPKIPELDRVTVTLDGNKAKIRPWAANDGCDLEYYCEVLLEYRNLEKKWGFEVGNGTGPKKFEVFHQLLTDDALSHWIDIVDDQGEGHPQNANNFNKCLRLLTEAVAGTKPRNRVTAYLEDPVLVAKRIGMTVAQHGARLAKLIRYHDLLHGDTAELGGNAPDKVLQRKKILFTSFPEPWRREFLKHNDEIHIPGNTWQKILRKMELYKTGETIDQIRRSPRNNTGRSQAQGGMRRSGGGRGHGRMSSYGGRGQSNRYASYRPYQNYSGNYQRYGNSGNYRPAGQYQNSFPPRNQGNRASGGRYASNNRYQGRFQGRNNGGRGRFPQRNQNYQYHQHYHAEEVAGGNQGNQQDTQMTSAEQHGTDSYYGRMASAEQHDAGQHQYDQQANQQAPQDYEAHYGYEQFDEQQDMTYDDIYGGELGDY